MAKIPGLRFKKGKPSKSMPLDKLVNSCYDYSEIHKLRDQVLDRMQETHLKTLMVGAPADGVGQTAMICLLRINIVRFASMRVLLVDLNLRSPQLHHVFGREQEIGFAEVVEGDVEWKKVIKKTDYHNLFTITAGKGTKAISNFLNRSLLYDRIEEMKPFFDLIIFDSSPLLIQNKNNIDPSLLSLICDMVVLVARYKHTTSAQLEASLRAIPEEREKLKGIVYNQNCE